MAKAYVYLVGASPKGPLKIGYTENLRGRLKALQIGCPIPLRFYGHRKYANLRTAKYAEKRMHRELAEFRIHGEWFKVDKKTAASAANKVLGPRLPYNERTTSKDPPLRLLGYAYYDQSGIYHPGDPEPKGWRKMKNRK